MEKKDQDLIKKVSKLIEEGKKRKITDFDSGLLQESFETIEGSTTERYEKWCKRLLNVATRLENLRIENKKSVDDENYSVLKEIDAVLKQKSPQIQIVKGDHGGNTIVCRDNPGGSCTCIPTAFDKTLEMVKEREYYGLITSIKLLEYKARARLDSFKWHRDDAVADVASVKEEVKA